MEKERAWEDLMTGRAGTTPPNPPSQGGEGASTLRKGGKRRDEIGMKAQLVQD